MINSVESETKISDKQVAEQLEILSVKIQEGIDKAYQVVKEAEEIKREIELQKADFSPTVEKAVSVGEQIQRWEEVLNQVAEVADKETIQRLEQEIESASNKINEVQSQVGHTDRIFDAFMSELQSRLVEVSQLKSQIEQDKQVVQDLAKETDDKYQRILQIFSQMSEKKESELPQKPPIINTISSENIADDLFSELDFHVGLDK
ncbi:hypothetical protein NIES267_57590 [Calothrix parasitica NIES-267]|uniref:Uncharacterized protein n=1 Tax=Calothrix parasitica NIES-267 TaxID=1973488 RepID=A0A1Z4LYF0_9CYAN|nr:hypothetical protein NIES267_57590 [Calothrix parasitica NIES-267]